MTWFYWIIGCLATYRLVVLISRDAGPFAVFKKLRSLDRGTKMLKCPFCVGVWAGAFVAAGFYLFGGVKETRAAWVAIALSFSAFSIMADQFFTRDYQA